MAVVVGASAVAGAVAAARRRRRRHEVLTAGGWQRGEYPSRDELEARRRARRNTFSSGVEFTMGKVRERSWLGGSPR
jgi:hypothetical protein